MISTDKITEIFYIIDEFNKNFQKTMSAHSIKPNNAIKTRNRQCKPSDSEVMTILDEVKIPTEGLFMNFDAGFDSEKLRDIVQKKGINANICQNKRNKKSGQRQEYYFDNELYKERYSIEKSNAWLDSFRSVLNRFDTTVSSWIGFNYLAFIVMGLRKFKKNKKSR